MLVDHEDHELAGAALGEADATIAHALTETYSVLTRLPGALRLRGTDAVRLIQARLPRQRVSLDADRTAEALAQLCSRGVTGGATYDGLIALTAQAFGLELVSLDRRAARTYGALGVQARLLAQG